MVFCPSGDNSSPSACLVTFTEVAGTRHVDSMSCGEQQADEEVEEDGDLICTEEDDAGYRQSCRKERLLLVVDLRC